MNCWNCAKEKQIAKEIISFWVERFIGIAKVRDRIPVRLNFCRLSSLNFVSCVLKLGSSSLQFNPSSGPSGYTSHVRRLIRKPNNIGRAYPPPIPHQSHKPLGDDGKIKKLNDEYIATFKTLPTYHHCTRFRISGIKAISRGISGGKQLIKFPSACNWGRGC